MASPQKENGYTPIANEIMEALYKTKMPPTCRQCIDLILRETWGYRVKAVRISNNDIANSCGIRRQHAVRAMSWLFNANILQKIVPEMGLCDDVRTKNGSNRTQTIKFNKNYDSWRVNSPKIGSMSDSPKNGSKNSPKIGSKSTPLPLDENNKRKKEIKKKKSFSIRSYQYPDWLNKKLWSEFVDMRSRSKHPITSETGITRLLNSLKKLIDEGHDQGEIIGLALERNWRGFFAPTINGGNGNGLSAAEQAKRDALMEHYRQLDAEDARKRQNQNC